MLRSTLERGTGSLDADPPAARPDARAGGLREDPPTARREGLGFDVDVIAYDPYVSAEELAEHGVEKVGFDELLDRADSVSIHTPLTEETRHLFDGDAFEAMDDDAVVVNTARGGVIDTDALAEALEEGRLRAVGLDVLPEEPPEDSPLVGRDDAVLTPHVGWYSEDSLVELRRTVAEDVARVLRGKEPQNPVNEL